MTLKPGTFVEIDKEFNRVNCGRSCLNLNARARRIRFDCPPTGDGDGVVTPTMRQFDTGATRNIDADKVDYEGFLSPLALKAFGAYMHKHRQQADGKLRDSDNWQKGILVESYMKSMWRHFFAVWETYRRTGAPDQEDLCALFFNVQGMLHEVVKKGGVSDGN